MWLLEFIFSLLSVNSFISITIQSNHESLFVRLLCLPSLSLPPIWSEMFFLQQFLQVQILHFKLHRIFLLTSHFSLVSPNTYVFRPHLYISVILFTLPGVSTSIDDLGSVWTKIQKIWRKSCVSLKMIVLILQVKCQKLEKFQ